MSFYTQPTTKSTNMLKKQRPGPGATWRDYSGSTSSSASSSLPEAIGTSRTMSFALGQARAYPQAVDSASSSRRSGGAGIPGDWRDERSAWREKSGRGNGGWLNPKSRQDCQADDNSERPPPPAYTATPDDQRRGGSGNASPTARMGWNRPWSSWAGSSSRSPSSDAYPTHSAGGRARQRDGRERNENGNWSIPEIMGLHPGTHSKLEMMIAALLILLLTIVILLGYSLIQQHRHHSRAVQLSGRPWHFTIPILSPFTSVVEHETSVIGSKTMLSYGCICAVLVYAMFRYWMGYAMKR